MLGVRIGDDLMVEFLEGKQLTQSVPLTGLSEDLAGIGAYMDRHQLNRLLGEGDLITGASFNVVGGQQPAFLMALKRIPRVSWVVIKESLRSSFRETTAASINLIQSIYPIDKRRTYRRRWSQNTGSQPRQAKRRICCRSALR